MSHPVQHGYINCIVRQKAQCMELYSCHSWLNISVRAVSKVGNLKTKPSFDKRSGMTHLLFRRSSVSVRITTAPSSNSHAEKGKPIVTCISLRKVCINVRLSTGVGAAQLNTPLRCLWDCMYRMMRYKSSMCIQLNICLPLPCLPPS